MSELTLTLIRLGLLLLLWVFVFSVTTVLRSDLYGTQISRRVLSKRQPEPRRSPGRQPAQPPAAKDAAEAPRPVRPGPRLPTGLVVTEGQLAGTSLPLGRGGVLIGRSPECTLVLDDEFSSGRHARIFPGPDGWLVEDLGSRNGTFLGGQKLVGTAPVAIGSVLRIGRTTLELRG
ncbi:FHA domain-containing protein [Lapillicoccus sp.]|uniref:FHA domain-containing protein FhaB/FipA n=1 Tax=Lapillicoccus sp. TaxID=1909287 RepID=UPI0025D623F8|nr:FHA domain-containing protein [Lapillicoccus sp.]